MALSIVGDGDGGAAALGDDAWDVPMDKGAFSLCFTRPLPLLLPPLPFPLLLLPLLPRADGEAVDWEAAVVCALLGGLGVCECAAWPNDPAGASIGDGPPRLNPGRVANGATLDATPGVGGTVAGDRGGDRGILLGDVRPVGGDVAPPPCGRGPARIDFRTDWRRHRLPRMTGWIDWTAASS